MFFGEYEYKVDSKGRLPLPPKFRQEFKPGLILTPGPEKCIVAYKTDYFKQIAEELAAQAQKIAEKEEKRRLRRSQRFTFGNAFDVSQDGQGRIALPANLKEYAQIADSVVIVGANDYIEIWKPEMWQTEKLEAERQEL